MLCLIEVCMQKGIEGLYGLVRYLFLASTNGGFYKFINKNNETQTMPAHNSRSKRALFFDTGNLQGLVLQHLSKREAWLCRLKG